MLNQKDLTAIKQVVREKIHEEVHKSVQMEIQKGFIPLKKAIQKLDKKVDLVISFFDKETTTLRHQVDRIESHLHLPPLS